MEARLGHHCGWRTSCAAPARSVWPTLGCRDGLSRRPMYQAHAQPSSAANRTNKRALQRRTCRAHIGRPPRPGRPATSKALRPDRAAALRARSAPGARPNGSQRQPRRPASRWSAGRPVRADFPVLRPISAQGPPTQRQRASPTERWCSGERSRHTPCAVCLERVPRQKCSALSARLANVTHNAPAALANGTRRVPATSPRRPVRRRGGSSPK